MTLQSDLLNVNLWNLYALAEAAASILESESDLYPNSGINWADFHCVAAYRRIDQSGQIDFQLEFEEAAPRIDNAIGKRLYELLQIRPLQIDFEW